MWTAPHLQELGSVRTGSLAIICPVSAIGHDRWPRWFPRHEFQTVTRYRIPLGRTECLTSWDRPTTPSAPSLASAGLSESRCSSPAELLCVDAFLRRGGARCQQGALRGAPTKRSAAPLAGHNFRGLNCTNVAFAPNHQLPGDASHFVGQGHCGKLGRLALEELDQPGGGVLSSLPDLLDQSRRPDDQTASQRLIAGASDHPEPRLAGSGMILRCQSNPSRKIPAR